MNAIRGHDFEAGFEQQLSENGSPTCTVGRFPSEFLAELRRAMEAPWMPSRPVLEPR